MGHLKDRYTKDYFGGGFEKTTGREYGVLGHTDFKSGRIHERLLGEFQFLVSFAGSLKNKDLLEIGFGREDHIPLYLRDGIRSYRGIDFAPASLSIAEQHVKDPKMSLERCDPKDLDETVSYDVITMFDVIEHIPVFEMEVICRKIRKMLRRKEWSYSARLSLTIRTPPTIPVSHTQRWACTVINRP